MPPEPSRAGVVALVGPPNAGKSTLVNALVGARLAIVSPKVQTTRTRLLGIAVEGATQLLLLDTPGLFAPRRRLDRAMVKDAWDASAAADLTLLLIDARAGLRPDTADLVARMKDRPGRFWLVLNKVDLVAKEALLALAADANARAPFAETFMISALTSDGVPDLKARLAAAMPAGPWLYPEDQLTNAPARHLAAELTREQLFLQLADELPYKTAVLPEGFEEKADGSAVIRQQILVEHDRQKAIVLGKGGTRIRAIGAAARQAIAQSLDRPVHLVLHVKARPGWADDRATLRDIGIAWCE